MSYFVEWLPTAWFLLILVVLAIYLALDGFDFGLGMIHALRSDPGERETLRNAFGPIWKANEVWLVLFVSVLFAAFPEVYSNILSRHYLTVFALLAALLTRGLGVKLREERDTTRWTRSCDTGFLAGSLAAPFLLGVILGAWAFGTASTFTPATTLTGFAIVALCLALGSAFAGLRTAGALRTATVGYGTWGVGLYVGLVLALLAYLGVSAGGTDVGLIPPISLGIAVVVLGAIAIIAARRTRWYASWASSVGLAGMLVVVLGSVLYPAIDPAADLLVTDAIVSPIALNMLTVVALIFLPLILAGFAMLYSIFDEGLDASADY